MSLLSLKPLDDIDSRREILRLFQLLKSDERIRFLTHVCKAIGPVGSTLRGENVEVIVTNSTSSPVEAYLDLMALCAQFGINPMSTVQSLEQWVKYLTNPGNKRIYVPEE